MPRETGPSMEKLPFKPSPMEIEKESFYDASSLGWEDAPSSRWPEHLEESLDVEPNCPINKAKIFCLAQMVKRLTNSI